jgi:hypothetical protein
MARVDKFTAADKQNQIYSDFLTNLSSHPASNDIVRFVNENAVTRSIKNLMLTDKGERLFQPKIGSNIRRMLFEPMGPSTATAISSYVSDTIEKHEPRAKVIRIDVIPNYDRNAYVISIVYFIINKQEPVTTEITLYRVR